MRERLLSRLARRLGSTRSLGPAQKPVHEPEPSDYDGVFKALVQRLPTLVAEVERNKDLAERRYADLVDGPPGRRDTVIENSRPSTLVAFTSRLTQESFAERFGDVERSLKLARVAVRTAEAASTSDYLSAQSHSDLHAEALLYLGNALRLNSDTDGAQKAFEQAEALLDQGTGDRSLRANLYSFRASLFMRLRLLDQSARLLDKEIALRRLLGDPRRVGVALTDRGIVACQLGPLTEACRYLRKGTLLAEDQQLALIALISLSEALARRGRGLDAWTVLCRAEAVAVLTGPGSLKLNLRWAKGLAYQALGEHREAEKCLRKVQESLAGDHRRFLAATASLDLACVLVCRKRFSEVKQLAAQAASLLAAEKIGARVLEATLLLRTAAEAESASERLAAKVANFVARSRYDREVRFE